MKRFVNRPASYGVAVRLLIAAAIVPFASDAIAELGASAGLYPAAWTRIVHAALVALLLLLVTIEQMFTLRRIDRVRQVALEDVRRSEERMRMQIDRMPVACITTTPDFRIASWNPAAQRIFGWTAEEIVGNSAAMLLPQPMTIELRVLWQRLLAGDAPASGANENVTKDGRRILCRWANTPLIDDYGRVTAVLSMAEDVTEENRAQVALRQAERRHRELVDQLPHYIFSVDADDRYIAVNAAACQTFGRPPHEVIGKTAIELGVPAEVARVWTDMNAKTRARGTIETVDMEASIGGSTRIFRAITSPLRDENGAVIGITGVSLDITEQRANETAVHRLMRAVEQLDEVMFTADLDGTITYVNPAFVRVYGYTREEAIGCTPRILKSGESSQEFYAQFWGELLAGRSVRIEYRNRAKDGTLVDVIGSASPLIAEDGKINGFVAVQQDVTAQKRAAEERRRFEESVAHFGKLESLGTLAGGIAHDVNNILSIILTHASLLERHADEARIAQVVATIKRAVQRGATLSQQILTFARRAEIKAECVEVSKLIMELGSMISETFPRTIQVTFDFDPELPSLTADSGKLHQALLNLCVNARDAMPDGGELTIGACAVPGESIAHLIPNPKQRNYVCLVVRDTGTGMSDETRRRIFEPFYTTKEKGRGTGLGLALVYGVVQSHGGAIDVESRLGYGTTFRLYIPIETPVASLRSQARPAGTVNGTESLLVIEDETPLLDAVKTQLRACGYRVLTANNGPEAIELLGSSAAGVDAVLMDLGMPKMPAVDLVRALRAAAPRLPIVAMTGYVDPEVHASVVAAGVACVVQKPFEVAELLRCLREVLEASAA
ncbi:MAG TPA: PAS domain S-box protein [Thermoanaerobaculia bacterium]|nr:PAS domain S-box protein [Thermoanaerobaculia bacterium]